MFSIHAFSLPTIQMLRQPNGVAGGTSNRSTILCSVRGEHLKSCGPYILALDTDAASGELSLEPLARAQNHMHCECIAPASPEVVKYSVEYVENLLRELSITCLNRWKDCQA